MNKYYVVIERVNAINIPVEANSPEEAADLANAKIARGEILDWDFDLADSGIWATQVSDRNFNHLLDI
jgi:hypothetical protein